MADRVIHQVIEGEPGERGPRGRPGLDAYEVARAAGFEGTRAQWLKSLVGPPGKSIKGDRGEQGPRGEPGIDGKDGAPGADGGFGLPLDAVFERDSATKLTQRLRLTFEEAVLQITPRHDADGYMTGATFALLV